MSADQHFLYRLQPLRAALLSGGPTEDERAIIGRHFGYLKNLCDQGVVDLAGRTMNPDESGFGIVILKAADVVAARRIMEDDPAVREGVMRATLFPFRIALTARTPPAT